MLCLNKEPAFKSKVKIIEAVFEDSKVWKAKVDELSVLPGSESMEFEALLAEGKAKQDLRMVEVELGGSNRLQINISTANGDVILTKEAIKQLEVFQNKLEENPLITRPVSVITIKSFLEKRNKLVSFSNVSQEKIEGTLSGIDNADNSFFKLFSEDFKSAGITIIFKEINTAQLEKLILDIQNDFNDTFNTEDYQLKINGFAVVFAQLNNFILETQFKSFFAAFFIAFLCLWFLLKV